MTGTKPINQGAVTSIADTDLVMVTGAGGGYHPISFANLLAAVKGMIHIGGRNLVKNSGTPISSNSGNIANYYYSDVPNVGDELIVTIWGQLGNGKTSFDAFNGAGDGTFGFTNLIKVSEGVYQGKFKVLKKVVNPGDQRISVYTAPSSTTNAVSTINRIKVERGNIGTDWTPAPEDIASGLWGGGNWLFTNYLQFGRERRCA